PPSRRPTKSSRSRRPTKSSIFLPDELIEEILSWLPANILLRLKCVSKKWHSLISHPYFLKLHQERSNAKMGKNHETRLRIFLKNQNLAAAYNQMCCYEKFLKAIDCLPVVLYWLVFHVGVLVFDLMSVIPFS
ncbi:hypothetical protein V8G54_010970, partial [Vigna mungo]